MFQRDLLQISPPEQLVVIHYDKLRFKAFSINLYITNQPSFSSDESIGPLLQAALKKHWRRRSYWALLQRLACMLLLYWRLFSVEMFLLYSWQHWGSLQLATGQWCTFIIDPHSNHKPRAVAPWFNWQQKKSDWSVNRQKVPPVTFQVFLWTDLPFPNVFYGLYSQIDPSIKINGFGKRSIWHVSLLTTDALRRVYRQSGLSQSQQSLSKSISYLLSAPCTPPSLGSSHVPSGFITLLIPLNLGAIPLERLPPSLSLFPHIKVTAVPCKCRGREVTVLPLEHNVVFLRQRDTIDSAQHKKNPREHLTVALHQHHHVRTTGALLPVSALQTDIRFIR